jgi:hypothetical protein
MPRFLPLAFAGLLSGAVIAARTALACEFVPFPDPLEVTPAPGPAPEPPQVTVEVRRAWHGPPGCGDCAEIGGLRLVLGPRDRSWEGLGLRLDVAAGAAPAGLVLPDGPVRANQGEVWLAWVDHPLRPLDFALRVSAVDGRGNASQPVVVPVTAPGRWRGCAAGAGGLALLAGGVFALVRAQRRRG